MYYISILPYILGIIAAIATGIISHDPGIGSADIYRRMFISMAVFFIFGMYLRYVLEQLVKEVENKKKEAALELEEELKKEASSEVKTEKNTTNEDRPASVIDYRVDDSMEEFTPLKASKVISRQLDK